MLANHFIARNLSGLRRVAEHIARINPDIVIGVARKGPRLAELCARHDLLLVPKGTPLVCHKALPFLEPESLRERTVVVFDDAVIWGSTMDSVVHHPMLARSSVKAVALAAEAGRDKLLLPDLFAPVKLGTDEVMAFSTDIVQAFGELAKPYNVDHPILQLSANTGNGTEAVIREAARKDLRAFIYNLTSPGGRELGVYNLVIDTPQMPGWRMLQSDFDLSKIRVFVDAGQGLIRVEPILIRRSSTSTLLNEEWVVPSSPGLREVYGRFRARVAEFPITDSERAQALYMLHTFLEELTLGASFARWLEKCLHLPAMGILANYLSKTDTELLLGDAICRDISGVGDFDSFMDQAAVDGSLLAPAVQAGGSTETYHSKLDPAVLSELDTLVNPLSSLPSNVSSIVCSLKPLDDKSRIPGKRSGGRLDFGFTVADISQLLSSYGVRHEKFELSATIDYLIDTGVLVPLTLLRPNGDIDRVFRFGEARLAIERRRFFVRTAFGEFHDRLKRLLPSYESAIPYVLASKVLAFAWLMGVKSKLIQDDDLALELVFGRYGAELEVRDTIARGRLLRWAVGEYILEPTEGGLRVHPKFDRRFDKNDNPLLKPAIGQVYSSMQWLADAVVALEDTKNRDRLCLALTTCNTAANTIEAIKAELKLWCADQNNDNAFTCLYDFFDLVDQARGGVTTEDITLAAHVLDRRLSRGPADLMNQARLKSQVFVELSSIRGRLDTAYGAHDKPGLDTFYELYVQDLIEAGATRAEQHELQILQILGRLCQTWTTVLRECAGALVAECNQKPASDILAESILHLNDIVAELKLCDPKFTLKTRLSAPPSMDSEVPLSEFLDAFQHEMHTMLLDIDELMRATLFVDETSNVEPIDHDVFILCYDWIGSSDDSDQYAVGNKRQRISKAILRYAQDRLGESDVPATQDDGAAFVIHDLKNIELALRCLCDVLSRENVCARISLYLAGAGAQRPVYDPKFKKYGGQAFVIAARILDHFRYEHWLKDGKTHVFVEQNTLAALNSLWQDLPTFRKLTGTPVKLKGKDLPLVEIYELAWIPGAANE